jgi:3-oxoacyl-[acyl-carrier protein] reductase|tara:strand:- start:529 stop:1221 length:693 start_codon:yes stop_codon:yes gene_type:complete
MYLIVGGSSDLANKIVADLSEYEDIIVTFRNSAKVKKIKSKKKKILYRKLDLNKLQSIRKFVLQNKKLLKNIKFINLATFTVDKLTHNLKNDDITKVFNVNLFSNITLARELLPIMVNQNIGKFIFFTSTRGERGDKGISLYSSSKQALSSFSRCLAKEYAGFNITSNCIRLGYFDTKLFNNISENVRSKLIREIPSKKLGNPINITKTILMISNTDYISGSDISIDGAI